MQRGARMAEVIDAQSFGCPGHVILERRGRVWLPNQLNLLYGHCLSVIWQQIREVGPLTLLDGRRTKREERAEPTQLWCCHNFLFLSASRRCCFAVVAVAENGHDLVRRLSVSRWVGPCFFSPRVSCCSPPFCSIFIESLISRPLNGSVSRSAGGQVSDAPDQRLRLRALHAGVVSNPDGRSLPWVCVDVRMAGPWSKVSHRRLL